MKSDADRIHIGSKNRITPCLILFSAFFILFTGHKVHVYSVFGKRTCHKFSVGRNNVSTVGFHSYVLFNETIGYVLPVLSFGKHGDTSLYDNCHAYQRHQKDDEEVTGHYIFFINCHSARLLKTLNSQFSTLHLFNKVRRIRRSLQIAFLT